MVALTDLRRLLVADRGLAVVTTLRGDGTVSASLVNVGVVRHPVDDQEVMAFVVRGVAHKLPRLRRQGLTTVVVHAGWEWASATGPADVVGPDDPLAGFDPVDLPALLRDVYQAAGGTHDDWDAFDRAMAEERRAAVLVRPARLGGNVAP